MRDQPRHPGIVTNNYQAIYLDVYADCGLRPTKECILPLACYCAVGTLDGRQREIRIVFRWWENVCAANAYLVTDPIGVCCWTHSKKQSSHERST